MKKIILSLICFIFAGILFSPVFNAQAQMKFAVEPDTRTLKPAVPSGYFFIKSVLAGDSSSGKGFWDQPGRNTRFNQGDKISIWTKDSEIDQQFQFVPAAGGWYRIVSRNGGDLDVTGGVNNENIQMQVYSNNGTASQRFRIEHVGEGRYRIFTAWGRAITLLGSINDGAPVVTFTLQPGNQSQEWYFINAATSQKYKPSVAGR